MIDRFNSIYKDLEYACRATPVIGIMGMRSLIEGVLNTIIVDKGYLEREDCQVKKLGRKLELLKGKNILSERQIHFISDVIYRGNDATHLLKGSENEARALYISLQENYEQLIELIEKSQDEEKKEEKKRRIGKIIEIKSNKNIGYIKNIENGEKYIFSTKELNGINEVTPKLGEEISFELVGNYNKSKAHYKAINLMYIGEIGLVMRNHGKSYSFVRNGDREEDIYLNVSYLDGKLKKEIVKGSKIEFKIIKGANKNEASEVRLAS